MSTSHNYWRRPKLPHSRVKSEIAAKYFKVWTDVLKWRSQRLCYLDLYAGKGTHDNNEPSTAIRIIGMACKDSILQEKLIVILNDVKQTYCQKTESVIMKYGYRRALTQEIKIINKRVDLQFAEALGELPHVPTFCFIDPYGFKGLSLELIRAVTKDWGCDCLLFFHTSGINRNMLNPENAQDMALIFGKDRHSKMVALSNSKFVSRENMVLEYFRNAVTEECCKYFLELRFNFPNSRRLSHHLILLTKKDRGLHLGKEVMSKYSLREDSIPSYIYVDGCEKAGDQWNLIGSGGPMDQLKEELMTMFGSMKISVKRIYDSYNSSGGRCTKRNVKHSLQLLEEEKKIMLSPQDGKKRRRGTGDTLIAHFPE